MSKKKRKSGATPSPDSPSASHPGIPGMQASAAPLSPATPLAPEAKPGDWTATLMALMIFLAPTLGVPNEEMLQDTLKSIIVSGISLVALIVFWWRERSRLTPLRWHALMWLPLALMGYALGSMVWSHTFLAGVEAIRWFIFSVIVFLGLNTFSRERFGTLAWGIHAGALGACLWTALQFWFDIKLFPQGPNPASTFVNRNFVAEFVVCTLPFSAWLILSARLRARGTSTLALLGLTTAFNIVAILMTGTRSALVAMLVFGGVITLVVRRYRQPLGLHLWRRAEKLTLASVMLGTVLVLGMVPSGNTALENELQTHGQHVVPIARSLMRVQSIADPQEYRDGARAFSIRWVMWSATGRLIVANPVLGVGAGAWEVQIPKYQAQGSQLETDYYVHNEILQLLAEYGVVGWLFLLSLFCYLAHAAWRTWHAQSVLDVSEAPIRSLVLASLLSFLIVSNLGFPWRMASTGAMFALCLGLLAASDARMGRFKLLGFDLVRKLAWTPRFNRISLGVAAGCLALCIYISHQAMEAERNIVRGVKLALTIAQSKQPNHPHWEASKKEMLDHMRVGIAITPHYRKLTPMVADELAKWGDWQNATWIWESVARSRPYIVAIMTNIARGYATQGNVDKAEEYLKRCEALQPNAPSVRSLQVIILGRKGQQKEALALTQKSLNEGIFDYDLSNAAYILGRMHGDWDLALRGLQLRTQHWPATVVDGWLKAGEIYADPKNPKYDRRLAQEAYRQAYAKALATDKAAVMAEIPLPYRGEISVMP